MVDKNRTKHEIFAALAELTETIPFDKVRVKQICDKAQVSRQTFYQYYRDKYDVAYSLVDEVIQDSFQRLGAEIGWREAYLETFKRMEPLAPLIVSLSETDDYNSIMNATIRNSQKDFSENYKSRFGHDPDGLIAFQIKWLGHLGTLAPTAWMAGGCQPGPDQFIEYFLTLIPNELYRALDGPSSHDD